MFCHEAEVLLVPVPLVEDVLQQWYVLLHAVRRERSNYSVVSALVPEFSELVPVNRVVNRDSYVPEVARANGQWGLELVLREVMPNLLPFIAASFVGAVASAMLAAIGLEALGLGANQVHTLGMIIYWSQKFTAVLRGLWWWWRPPIVMIAIIFMGLFLLSIGLDRVANPRLRQRT